MSLATELTRIQESKDIFATAMSDLRKCVRLELDHAVDPEFNYNGIEKLDDSVYKLSPMAAGYIGVTGSSRSSYGEAELIVVVRVLQGPSDAGSVEFIDTGDGVTTHVIGGLGADVNMVSLILPAKPVGYLKFTGYDSASELEFYISVYERDGSTVNPIIGNVNGTEKLDELAVALYVDKFSDN